MDKILAERRKKEAALAVDADRHMAQATQALWEMTTACPNQVKILAGEIVSGQKNLQTGISSLSSQLDKLVTSSTDLSLNVKKTEDEAELITSLEAWIDLTMQELEQMKEQIIFLNDLNETHSKKQLAITKLENMQGPPL
jgi:uncharacterized phage infection (PIP) family protein YhgE